MWGVMERGEPYEPWDWQAQHIHAKADMRYLIYAIGRRGGKSAAMTAEVIRELSKPPVKVDGKFHYPLVYIVAPNYEMTMRIWEPVWDLFVGDDQGPMAPLATFRANHDKQRKLIWLKTGARVQAKSADDPKSMRGERVTAAFIDEAQDMPEDAFQALLPALMDSSGVLRMTGTAKGRGRFRTYFILGQQDEEGFYSFSGPSTLNHNISEEDMELERRTHTENEFRQEYLAEWTEAEGLVFKNYEQCFTGGWVPPPGNGANIMGLDIGKINDYTVAYIGNVKNEQIVAKDRFRGLDFTILEPRIAKLYRDYNCRFIYMDATGMGEGPADHLRALGCSVISEKFTNESKGRIISAFVRETEQNRVILPREDSDLRNEMSLYEAFPIGNQNLIGYSAPAGYHDDCVVAAALVNYKMARNRGMDRPKPAPYVTWRSSDKPRAHMAPLPAVKVV